MTIPKLPEPQLLGYCRFYALTKIPFLLGKRPFSLPCVQEAGRAHRGGAGTHETPALTSELPSSPYWAPTLAWCSLPLSTSFHSVTQDLSCCHIQSQSQPLPPCLTCHSKDFKYCLALGDSDTYQWILASTRAQSSLKISHSPNGTNTIPTVMPPTVT